MLQLYAASDSERLHVCDSRHVAIAVATVLLNAAVAVRPGPEDLQMQVGLDFYAQAKPSEFGNPLISVSTVDFLAGQHAYTKLW